MPDFEAALHTLAPEFRERYALPEIHPLGLAVEDAEKAALKLEKQGLPPFFIIEFISQRCFGLKWWPMDAIFKAAAAFRNGPASGVFLYSYWRLYCASSD